MTLSIEVNDKLVKDGLEFSGLTSKEALIIEALSLYVDKLARKRLLEAFGTVDYDPDYDPKAHR